MLMPKVCKSFRNFCNSYCKLLQVFAVYFILFYFIVHERAALTLTFTYSVEDKEVRGNFVQALLSKHIIHTFKHTGLIFSARCNIYISRLSYDASVRLSVRLSVTFVHCGTGCNGSRISLHAWIDGCLYYLLTTPHPDRRMG